MINGVYVQDLVLKNVPGVMIPRYYRNFSGNERKNKNGKIVNTYGQRNFVVKFDEEQGKALESQGWDLFWFNQTDDEPRQAGLTVPVNLSRTTMRGEPRTPDQVIVVTDTQRNLQDEKTIGNLDSVTIESADILLTPRPKQKNDGTVKIACYLKKMYVKIQTSDFDAPYDNLPWGE